MKGILVYIVLLNLFNIVNSRENNKYNIHRLDTINPEQTDNINIDNNKDILLPLKDICKKYANVYDKYTKFINKINNFYLYITDFYKNIKSLEGKYIKSEKNIKFNSNGINQYVNNSLHDTIKYQNKKILNITNIKNELIDL